MCFICDRIEQIKNGSNPYFVAELETGYVVLGDNQHFRGYTLFLYKRHEDKTELFDLEPAERAKFMEEMSQVARAVKRAFGAEKMYAENSRPTPAELEDMKSRLRAELDRSPRH